MFVLFFLRTDCMLRSKTGIFTRFLFLARFSCCSVPDSWRRLDLGPPDRLRRVQHLFLLGTTIKRREGFAGGDQGRSGHSNHPSHSTHTDRQVVQKCLNLDVAEVEKITGIISLAIIILTRRRFIWQLRRIITIQRKRTTYRWIKRSLSFSSSRRVRISTGNESQ